MAIQQRRGAKADFDATKMLPGELAVTTDGSRKVYVAFAPGDAKELASTEEVEYVCDTQKHIEQNYVSKEAHQEHENRIAELEKAIVNS